MRTFRAPYVAPLKNFSPLKSHFVQNRWSLIGGLISLLIVDFLQLLIPLVIKDAIDLFTLNAGTPLVLLKQSGLILAIALGIVLLRYIWRVLIFGHSRKVEVYLRNRVYKHLQKLSPSFYQRMRTGDLMARSINDINAVRMATGMGLVALIDGIVLGTAAIGFMLSISVTLSLIALIPAPLVVLCSKRLTRKMSAGFDAVQSTFSDLTEMVRESFAGIRVVKAYVREKWESRRIRDQGRKYLSVNINLAKTLALFFPLMAVFTNLGLVVVIWLGGRFAILGHITIGDFVAFTAYLNLLTWPMMAMGWVINLLQRGAISMGRINRIFEEVPEISTPRHPRPVNRIKGPIEFKGLSLRHAGQTAYALKDVSFEVPAGKTVAIVGGVGAGKTSLLQTIPRLLDAPSGTLFVDGLDVRDISLHQLRQGIGFVPQEPFIFSDTIRNNVLFGKTGVSLLELEDVLRTAGLFEEIQDIQYGLDTLLGERGVTLSGGQRQRLTIARALLNKPAVFILDDALSMVDTRTEAYILRRIMQTRGDRTNLIVSHRVSTISKADKIIVLAHGKVVERGTHESLLALKGVYSGLYQTQLLAQALETGGQ